MADSPSPPTHVLIGEMLGAILVCEAVGGVAAWATQTTVTTWYPTLAKPPFTPPGWLFGPVWTALYALMGIAAALVWRSDAASPAIRRALVLFGGQLLLNGAWPFAFFWARSPGGGLGLIVALWAAVAATLGAFFRLRRWAGGLLVPYLAWVSYAVYLNAGVFLLN